MRLEKIQRKLQEMHLEYRYTEVDGCGSLDFAYRGVGYHVWEFEDNGFGAETNVRNGGQSEDISNNYEEEIIKILNAWK